MQNFISNKYKYATNRKGKSQFSTRCREKSLILLFLYLSLFSAFNKLYRICHNDEYGIHALKACKFLFQSKRSDHKDQRWDKRECENWVTLISTQTASKCLKSSNVILVFILIFVHKTHTIYLIRLVTVKLISHLSLVIIPY